MKRILSLCIAISVAQAVSGQIRLPQIIRDSMVLQRDQKIHVWGWASKGEKVTIHFNGKNYKAIAASTGEWALQLEAEKAGGPYTMAIAGKNKIILKDILIGDVWVCAGQSNMEHQMKLHNVVYSKEIAEADYPEIRQFKVPNITDLVGPRKDINGGSWKSANSTDVNEFSAVAYFFAKTLYEKYHVPIGIINASWGGAPIEAFMSEESLRNFPDILQTIAENKDTAELHHRNSQAFKEAQKIERPIDKGITQKWFSPSYDPKGWRRISVPGYWEDQGIKNLDGIVWYRKEVDVPASLAVGPSKVFLGRIVDADELYINGEKVGTTTYLYPQRRYPVPEGLLKPGKNVIVVRVTNNAGKGGFVPDKPYELIGESDTIDLTGYWQYKVGAAYSPNKNSGIGAITIQYQPTAIFNSMIAPLTAYRIKGFTWYQGESNTGRPDVYAALQPAMIADWRKRWNEGNIPFLFVQLPGFMDYNYLPEESNWATFREAQAKSLSVPNTGMAVAIDLGEWNDVHPDRKKEVGERLALAAEKTGYGEEIVYSGPVYRSFVIDGNKIVLSFTHTGSGLVTNNGEPPAGFAIAGADKKFVWANAQIQGNKIVLSNDLIKDPRYVRYAWADNPVSPNLYNREGLPAAPFRTDQD